MHHYMQDTIHDLTQLTVSTYDFFSTPLDPKDKSTDDSAPLRWIKMVSYAWAPESGNQLQGDGCHQTTETPTTAPQEIF